MITEELIEKLKSANENLVTAQKVSEEKNKIAKAASDEATFAMTALASASRELNGVKAEVANALNADPVPVPSPIVRPAPVPVQSTNNNMFIVIMIAAAIFLAIHFGVVEINNPFNPVPPGPNPPPIPGPVLTDPIRVSYIYDKDNADQTTREIRNNVEKIESELKSVQAEYRAYDVNDDEVKKNYMDAVMESNKHLPILVIQNDKTGKKIGDIILAPASSDDIINATKNARNGK